MYANTDNPPGIPGHDEAGIDTASHINRLSCIMGALTLIEQARSRLDYSREQYDRYTPGTSPFVSRARWQDDVGKWAYIIRRLEQYYFRKVCELTSSAYRSIVNNV